MYKADDKRAIHCNIREIMEHKRAEEEIRRPNEPSNDASSNARCQLVSFNEKSKTFSYSAAHGLRQSFNG